MLQRCSAEVSPFNIGASEVGSGQVAITHPGPRQVRAFKVGGSERSSTEVGVSECRTDRVQTIEIAIRTIDAPKILVAEVAILDELGSSLF